MAAQPNSMGNCHGPELGISGVRPMNGCMDEHAPCNGGNGVDCTFCYCILMVGPRGRVVGFDLELFGVFSVLLGSEGGAIVCHDFLHNDTTVKTGLLEVLCCFQSLMGVEVRLHLGVDVSRGMIHKDTGSTVEILVVRSPS